MRELTEKDLATALQECDEYQLSTGTGSPSDRRIAEENLARYASWAIPELVSHAERLEERRKYGADIINDMTLEAEVNNRHLEVMEARLHAAIKTRPKFGFASIESGADDSDAFPKGWKTHELKTWPEEYQALEKGLKTADLRCNDRNYQVGDHLLLREYDLTTGQYTGQEHYQEIKHIVTGPAFGIIDGYVMLSLVRLPF